MGKIITEVVLASIAFVGIFSLAWWVAKTWFFKAMPSHINTVRNINKASDKYDTALGFTEEECDEEIKTRKKSRD